MSSFRRRAGTGLTALVLVVPVAVAVTQTSGREPLTRSTSGC